MHADIQTRMLFPRRMAWLAMAAVLCAVPAAAQLTVGENLKMNLSGSLGYGYSATYGDTSAGHGQNLVGNGVLTGSYYNPGFLSFSVRPYWDRTQNNATAGLTAHDSGIDSSVNLFSGSSFPGAVSYSKAFSSSSEFGVPGTSGIQTRGSGQSFGVTWSELIQGLPPVYASFSDSTGEFNALGSVGSNSTRSKNFNTGTSYQYLGFNLTGAYTWANSGFDYTDVLGTSSSGSSTMSTASFGAQHNLPFNGGVGLSYSHSTYNSRSNAGTSGSTNNMTASSSFMPWSRFSFSGQMQYTTNLTVAISQQSLPSGGSLTQSDSSDSNSLSLGGGASYIIGHGWTTYANANRIKVKFGGYERESTQFSASVAYHFAQNWLGMLHCSFGLVDLANKQGNSGMSLVGSVGIDRIIHRWDVSADFAYSQDVRTLYGLATTSNYSYGGSLRKKLAQSTYWAGTARAAHSGFSQQAGTVSASESVTNSLMWRRYSVSGSYSQAEGQSILSSSGVLTPVTGVGLITNEYQLFNGHSISVSGSTRIGRMNVSGVYARSRSDLQSPTARTFSLGQSYNARFDYRLRKMTLTGGYSRVNQNASIVKSGPFVVNSFYLSFSRWFNVF